MPSVNLCHLLIGMKRFDEQKSLTGGQGILANIIDDKLREKNLKLAGYAFMMPAFRPKITIKTEWIDREQAPKGQKRNPTAMIASHCPFCGVAYEKDDEQLTPPKPK